MWPLIRNRRPVPIQMSTVAGATRLFLILQEKLTDVRSYPLHWAAGQTTEETERYKAGKRPRKSLLRSRPTIVIMSIDYI